ncbi:MAG TPA: methyltransferase domain-containing protein [Polyangia bacterium]|nr:methyltransferase domain-containing protein [Polyangia bacterium]
MLTAEQRARTLARFEEHRQAWDRNPVLQVLYADWYGRIRRELPAPSLGSWWELGSGPGFARQFIPELSLSDLVAAPWHDREIAADALPFAYGEIGALVLFDVLHHLPSPRRFFEEAARVLRVGGRLVLCEPYVSALSYPVYKFLHEEPLHLVGVDPLAMGEATTAGNGNGVSSDAGGASEKDPFDSNQGIPTLMFGRAAGRAAFERSFPTLALRKLERLAGPSYPASGGFSRGSLLPAGLWRRLFAVEQLLPQPFFRLAGFRMLVVLEKIG